MIRLENVYKLWGPDPMGGIDLLNQGKTKDELLNEHGLVVGLNDISLNVKQGELFVIMGLSGSGKSTLIRTINRLVEPTAGQIFLEDDEVTAMEGAELRKLRSRRMSMVFQNFALLPHRTVLENTVFGLEVQNVPKEERNEKALETLELVGLGGWADYLPDQLSGGMQQRVGLARALATDSDVLLMDEAFSALDPLIRKEVQVELLRLQQRLKKTIVFITHDLDEALSIGDRIAILRAGKVLQVGTPEQIVLDPADDHVATFVQGVNLLNVLTASKIAIPLADLATPTTSSNDHRVVEAGRNEMLILDQEQRPIGLLNAQQYQTHQNNIDEANIRPAFTVQEGTLLRDLLRAGTEAFPAVVVGDDGRAQGVIRARGIVNAISDWDEHTSEIIEAATPEDELDEPRSPAEMGEVGVETTEVQVAEKES